MSEALDIRGGGAIAVDTATLRTAARGFTQQALELHEIAAMIGTAALRLFEISDDTLDLAYEVDAVRRRICAVLEEANRISAALLGAATVYEIVELRAERAAAAASGDAVAGIDARLADLARQHPDAARQATLDVLVHAATWPADLAQQASGVLWWLAPGFGATAVPMVWSLQHALGTARLGTIPRSALLGGRADEVVVSPVTPRGPVGPPGTLAQAAGRIPGGAEVRIRIERYEMRDGSRQFAVYVAGTQTLRSGTSDAFDMDSNVELYTGERSASYEAARAALQEAGAQAGDVVHAFGHSQGAMITSRLAMEGGYDVQTLVSFGSPVEADVGEGTLSVALRHTDDPVAALAGGGHAGSVGAPGSFVAERTADPALGIHDLSLPAHGIAGYTETAKLLDESPDARMRGVRRVFDDLEDAASVRVTEYAAHRVVTPVVPQPQPQAAPTPLSPVPSGGG